MFKNYRIRVIKDKRAIKEILKTSKKFGLKIVKIGFGGDYASLNEFIAKEHGLHLQDNIIINLKETKLEISSYYYENHNTTYIFSLNEEEVGNNSGRQCFAQFNRAFTVYPAKNYQSKELENWYNPEQGKYICSASPILGYNQKYEMKELKDCYEYDLNSAYFSTLLNKIPDLEHPIFGNNIKIPSGYIGFYIDDHLTMLEKGTADVIFPLIETPKGIKEFCSRFYEQKKKLPKGTQERKNAKDMLNLPIGYCQRYNPFLRSYVIYTCNKLIRSLIDENTLFWNTDAIFSLTKRNDLDIGDKIGQFKEEKIDCLRYKGNTYQLNGDCPVYRGIPKNWFKNFEKVHGREYNLITDDLPDKMNKYEWDWEKLTLKEIQYEEA